MELVQLAAGVVTSGWLCRHHPRWSSDMAAVCARVRERRCRRPERDAVLHRQAERRERRPLRQEHRRM